MSLIDHQDSAGIVAALQTTRLHKDRKSLLEVVWYKGNREFFLGIQAALDPTLDYGISRAPEYDLDGTESPEELQEGDLCWAEFKTVLDLLVSRKLVGEDAEATVVDLAERSPVLLWNMWYRRILLRDLRCGLNASVINQAIKKIGREAAAYRIPVLKLPKGSPLASNRGGMLGEKYLEPSLAGRRVGVMVKPRAGIVGMFDQDGEALAAPDFLPVLLDVEGLTEDMLLDGWLTGNDFRTHMTTGQPGDSHLAISDAIPLDAARQGYCSTPLRDRLKALSALRSGLMAATGGTVWILPKLMADLTTSDGRHNLADFREECLGAGYDAIVVKDAQSSYGSKASDWIEVKGSDDLGYL
jgi:DNA ligase-1